MSLRTGWPSTVSSSVFCPWSTCDRYKAAIATLTVLAMGKGVSPLMLTLSPVLRSRAAIPTSAELPETSEASCCSTDTRSGEDAAAAGAATNARSDRKIATNLICLTASRAHIRLIAERPHSFQIVKISDFGTKNVNDHIVRVDQHPIRCREPLDPNDPSKLLFNLVGKLTGHRRDLAGR